MIKIDHINVIRLVDNQQKAVRVAELKAMLESMNDLEDYRAALRKIYELVYHTPVDIHFRYTMSYDDTGSQDSRDHKKSSG